MKCTNCGKNNASFHYQSNINGNVTEYHLCPECAARFSRERELASMPGMELFPELGGAFEELSDGFTSDSFFGDSFFGDSIFGNSGVFSNSLLGGGLLNGLFGGNSIGPMLGFIQIEPRVIRYEERPRRERGMASRESDKIDNELSQEREKNVLREQIRMAVESEDYERAARLRDELKRKEVNG